MNPKDKSAKKGTVLKVLLKILVFAALLWFIYWQLGGKNLKALADVRIVNWWALILCVVLLIFNQGIEYLKWRLIATQLISEERTIWLSFLAGISSGFVTPNGWGNFLGRMIHFRKRNRSFVILSSFLSNGSQLMPTVLFGVFACFLSSKLPLWLAVLAAIVGMLIFLAYWFLEYVVPKKHSRKVWLRHLQLTTEKVLRFRMPLFIWSVLRYLVFSFQFALLFVALGYHDYWQLLANVWLIYALTSFIPSLWSGKVLIRETAALFVFAGTAVLPSHVVAASLAIWLINNVIPVGISSFVWIPLRKRENYDLAH